MKLPVVLASLMLLGVLGSGPAFGVAGDDKDAATLPGATAVQCQNGVPGLPPVTESLQPPGLDAWCVTVLVPGAYTFNADTVDPSSSVDLVAFVTNAAGAYLGGGDDNVPCTHPPASGYACPQFTLTLAPGDYTLNVYRFDWVFWYGEPVHGEYEATIGALPVLTSLVQDDDQ